MTSILAINNRGRGRTAGLLRTRPSNPSRTDSLVFRSSRTGIAVNEATAMQNNVVLACVQVISETVGTLPWRQYTNDGDDRNIVEDGVDGLIHIAPNDDMSAQTFIETMMVNMLLWRNAFAEIATTLMGEPVAMRPIEPWRVSAKRGSDGVLFYEVRNPPGHEVVQVPASQMFHIKGISFDGVMGIPLMAMAREAIGLGIALERFMSEFFGNSGVPGGVLEHPKRLDEPQVEQLREQWTNMHGGPGNRFKVAVLANGVTFKPVASNVKDAQVKDIEGPILRRITRIFRVPPHLVGDLSDAKWANIEQQKIDFADSLVPQLKRFECEADRKLLHRHLGGKLFTKFNMAALLRADFKTRQEGLSIQRQNGIIDANEWRRLEDMNSRVGGDELWQPVNMADANATSSDAPRPVGPPPKAEPVQSPTVNMRPLVEAAFARIYAKEARAVLRRADKDDQEGTAAWAGKFYDSHGLMVIETLSPIVKASGADVDLQRVSVAHCGMSERSVVKAANDKLKDLVADWEKSRIVEEVDSFLAALAGGEGKC